MPELECRIVERQDVLGWHVGLDVVAARDDVAAARREVLHLPGDIGTDLGSAVDFTYKLPFSFTGKIEKVTFDLK